MKGNKEMALAGVLDSGLSWPAREPGEEWGSLANVRGKLGTV